MWGCPYNKDYRSWGSVLGPPLFGKLPCEAQCFLIFLRAFMFFMKAGVYGLTEGLKRFRVGLHFGVQDLGSALWQKIRFSETIQSS